MGGNNNDAIKALIAAAGPAAERKVTSAHAFCPPFCPLHLSLAFAPSDEAPASTPQLGPPVGPNHPWDPPAGSRGSAFGAKLEPRCALGLLTGALPLSRAKPFDPPLASKVDFPVTDPHGPPRTPTDPSGPKPFAWLRLPKRPSSAYSWGARLAMRRRRRSQRAASQGCRYRRRCRSTTGRSADEGPD